MSRDLLHGDASFTWTAWWDVARDLNMSGELDGWRDQFRESDVTRGVERGWGTEEEVRHTARQIASGIVAQEYALALSSLGWCLRDAGALAAADQTGSNRGGYTGMCMLLGESVAPGMFWEPNAIGAPHLRYLALKLDKST